MGRKHIKGGRPPKLKNEKMSKLVSIYLTPVELELINIYLSENNVINISKSEFFRTIILKTIDQREIVLKRNSDPKIVLELNRIGLNLNQIAKKMNSLNALSRDDVLKLNECYDQLGKAISKY
ncbi:plasmid mobilization relaxosome protein MobC [Maribacter sp. HS]|uniref:plasmid mobilization protein n=1 Tax=Maribacter sp. HS TaxID=3110480 RepID=UPI003A8B0331